MGVPLPLTRLLSPEVDAGDAVAECLEFVGSGDEETQRAVGEVCRRAPGREAYLYLMQKIASEERVLAIGELLHLVGIAVHGITRRVDAFVASLVSDVRIAIHRLSQQDAVMLVSHGMGNDEGEDTMPLDTPKPPPPTDPPRALAHALPALVAIAEHGKEHVSDHNGVYAVLAFSLLALRATFCAPQLRPEGADSEPPTSHPSLTLTEEDYFDVPVAAAQATLVEVVEWAAGKVGKGPPFHFLLLEACRRESAKGVRLVRHPDYTTSFWDDDDDEGEGEGDALLTELLPPALDTIGIGAFLALTAFRDPATHLLSPFHILLSSLPYLRDMLLSTSQCCVSHAITSAMGMIEAIDPYSVCVEGGEEDAGHVTTSRSLEVTFEFTQGLSHVMTQCPSALLRSRADETIQAFYKIFAEADRFKLLRAFIELCPFPSVASVMVTRLKEEVALEYTAGAGVTSKPSLFLRRKVVGFMCDLIRTKGARLALGMADEEVVSAAMNLLIFVLLREQHTPVLNLGKSDRADIRKALDSLDPSRIPEGAHTVLSGPLLEMTRSRLYELIGDP